MCSSSGVLGIHKDGKFGYNEKYFGMSHSAMQCDGGDEVLYRNALALLNTQVCHICHICHNTL